MNEPTCKMCNAGTIMKTKVYRMSKVGVAIGYIVLVLSALGLLFAVVLLLTMPRGDRNALQELGDGLAEAGAMCIGFSSLVGAFFGCLLVLKKQVLKCNQCGVEVPVSLSGMYDGAA